MRTDISGQHRERNQIHYRTKKLPNQAVTQPKQHNIKITNSTNINIPIDKASKPTLQENTG